MAEIAQQVAAANGLSSSSGGPITVVPGKLEEIKELPGGKVDIIVSEWMGYALLFETMLDSVLAARDRLLLPGGALLPDLASLHLAAATVHATGLNFWTDVYGLDMSCVAQRLSSEGRSRAAVVPVEAKHVVSHAAVIKELDLTTCAASDQYFNAPFTLQLNPQAPALSPASPTAAPPSFVEVAALVLWFDVDFSPRFCTDHPVKLSTSPSEPLTHWAQTVLALQVPIRLGLPGQDEGLGGTEEVAERLVGRVSFGQGSRHRSLDISLEVEGVSYAGKSLCQQTMLYHMSVDGSS